MKNINNVVRYMRKKSSEFNGIIMNISHDLWDHIANILEQYTLTPVKDHPPEKSGEYLCLCDNGRFTVLHYSKRHNAFNAHDECHEATWEINVIAWCELPEVPEELKEWEK